MNADLTISNCQFLLNAVVEMRDSPDLSPFSLNRYLKGAGQAVRTIYE